MIRRTFLQRTLVYGAATMLGAFRTSSLDAAVRWPIGCFNRAWTKWSYDDALDGIAAAGYKVTGLLSGHKGESFTSADATPAATPGESLKAAALGQAKPEGDPTKPTAEPEIVPGEIATPEAIVPVEPATT